MFYIIEDNERIAAISETPPKPDELQAIANETGCTITVISGERWGVSVAPTWRADADDEEDESMDDATRYALGAM